jgi:hypothetical protein
MSVISLQVWAVGPEPRVKVTTLVGSGVPGVGVSDVRSPLSVVGWPLTALVGPVETKELVSGLTVKVLDELSDPIGVEAVSSPEKEAVRV